MREQNLQNLAIAGMVFFMLSFAYLLTLASKVELSANYSALFSSETPASHYRNFHRATFGADDTLLISIIEPDIVDQTFLTALAKTTTELANEQAFLRVNSITNSAIIQHSEDEIIIEPLIDAETLSSRQLNTAEIQSLIAKMRQSPLLKNRYLSESHDSFIIMAELPDEFDNARMVTPMADYFTDVIENNFQSSTTYIQFSGVAFTRIALMDLMKDDLSLLIPLCALLISLGLWFLYRSWLPIFVTVVIICYSLTATLAAMYVLNIDLNQLTMIFPLISMIVIVANILHFFQCFSKSIDQSQDYIKALRLTADSITKATLLSCVTTAIGFFSLTISDMPILREFGLIMGISLIISAITLSALLLSLLICLKSLRFNIHTNQHFNHFNYQTQLLPLYLFITAIISIIALLLLPQNKFDFFLEDMLQKNHPQILSAQALNNQFAGSLPLEISLLGQKDDFKRPKNLQHIQLLQQWLDDRGIHDSLSLATVVEQISIAFDQTGIPEDESLLAQYILLAEASGDDLVSQLATSDFSTARIRAFMPDMGSQTFKQFKRDFDLYAAGIFASTGIVITVTGEMPLVYDGFDRLTHELLLSLLLAIICILLVIGFIFKKTYLLIASIFPNVLPILMGLAFYSFFDDGLNPLPAMAFCIGIGIAVDDTIHLFSRFQQLINQGHEVEEAMNIALNSTASALILSSIILIAGFMLFLLSEFTWSQELGLLVSFMIFSALLADLYLTPACLYYLYSKRQPKIFDH